MEKYRFSKTEQEIYEGMQVPFAVYQFLDKHVVTIALSQGFLEVFGYTDRGQAYFDMDNNMYVDTHPDDIMRIEEAAVRFATEDTEYDVVYRSRKHGGAEYFIVHAYGRHVVTDDGVRLAYIWYADEGEYSEDDKKETKLYHELNKALREESIIKSSHYDYLTGLPNMTFFFEIAKQLRVSAVENGCKPALLYLDLCGLKYYNHKHGFAEGDNLLRSFAKLLAKTFGNDKCCHIGQDHFAAFSIESVLESKLDAVFAEFRRMQSDTLPVRVGIYRDTDDKVIPVSVACDRAKLACDSLRGSAESAYAYYRSEFRDRIIKKQYIIENFEKALAEERIEVYYQPIIRAVNGRVCDEEALSRWHDPDLGLLSPADFIPALEESKLIYKLDLYLLEHVLEKMKKQVEFGLTMVPHSINLSRSDFESCDIVEEIRKRVDAAGIDHGMISIEITESVIGKDFDYMKERVERFRALGFPVWMDDFGVAYSSLDLLQSLKFDLIKFDMGFMQKLDENENGKVILTELMIMATSLGLDTVCEGVET
ncbi:MAG: EAL domain-containing protein, partial [Clostridia bacterium]|nr:EAL domain-containing protein [Clostridia bacterium]